jgi:predicted anti-sigma-YlaC factor YlaD
MNCVTIRGLLPLFAYDDVGLLEARTIQSHLSECAECRAELAEFNLARQAIDGMPAPRVSIDSETICGKSSLPTLPKKTWRSVATIAGIAAALIGFALLKLEVRIDGSQLVVRWGAPTDVTMQVTQSAPASLAALEERVQLLQNLTRALANDVAQRDQILKNEWVAERNRLEAATHLAVLRSQEAGRDIDALYVAQFKPTNEGAKK